MAQDPCSRSQNSRQVRRKEVPQSTLRERVADGTAPTMTSRSGKRRVQFTMDSDTFG